MATSFATSWVPNWIKTNARAFDDKRRDMTIRKREDKSKPQQFGDLLKYQALPVPGLAPTVKRDIWGNELTKQEGFGPATDVLWRMVSPIQVQKAVIPQNFDRMIFNYNQNVRDQNELKAENAPTLKEVWPSLPSPTLTMPGKPMTDKGIHLSDADYDKLLAARTKYFVQLAANHKWNFDKPTYEDMLIFTRTLDRAEEAARRTMLADYIRKQSVSK
jgi:hypothetical protein